MAMELRNDIFQKVVDNIEKEGDVLDYRVIEEANERLSMQLKGYTEKHPLNITRRGIYPSFLYLIINVILVNIILSRSFLMD